MVDEERRRNNTDLLLKLLAITFAAWAAVVAWGVDRVTTELSELRKDQRAQSEALQGFMISNEKRITRLEEHETMQDTEHRAVESRTTDIERRLNNARLK